MKVAYYSPLPPERSGIADYSALLLPALERRIDVAVVRRGRRRRRPRADVALYHVGNDPHAHGWIVEALRGRPGVVVLHDFVLHHLVAGMTLGRRDRDGYLDAMQREAGVVGRLLAHGVVDGLVPPPWEARPQDFPLTAGVLETATGVIVHSRYVEQRVRDTGYLGQVWRIPHPAWRPPESIRAADLADGGTVIGCFGHLTAAKRLPELLEAFALVREALPSTRLLLVGSAPADARVEETLARLGLGRGDVVRFDYVDEERLWALLAATDVCVCLRHPTMGETSGIAIRSLSLGRPLVVSDVGWFAELPDAVAAKVPTGEHEVSVLAETLGRLLADQAAREGMGSAARALAVGEHDVERVADAYAAALEDAAGGDTVREKVAAELAAAADEVGMAPDGAALGQVAAHLHEIANGD